MTGPPPPPPAMEAATERFRRLLLVEKIDKHICQWRYYLAKAKYVDRLFVSLCVCMSVILHTRGRLGTNEYLRKRTQRIIMAEI